MQQSRVVIYQIQKMEEDKLSTFPTLMHHLSMGMKHNTIATLVDMVYREGISHECVLEMEIVQLGTGQGSDQLVNVRLQ